MATSSCWSPPMTPLENGSHRVFSPLLVKLTTLLIRIDALVRNGLLGSRSKLKYEPGEVITPKGFPVPIGPSGPVTAGTGVGLIVTPPVEANCADPPSLLLLS